MVLSRFGRCVKERTVVLTNPLMNMVSVPAFPFVPRHGFVLSSHFLIFSNSSTYSLRRHLPCPWGHITSKSHVTSIISLVVSSRKYFFGILAVDFNVSYKKGNINPFLSLRRPIIPEWKFLYLKLPTRTFIYPLFPWIFLCKLKIYGRKDMLCKAPGKYYITYNLSSTNCRCR